MADMNNLGFDETTNSFLNNQRSTMNLTERGYENDLGNIQDANTNGLLQTYTNIYLRANNTNIGMIQSFTTTENRTVTKLQAIGNEGVCQSVPQNYDGGQISASRLQLYGERLYDAFKLKSSSQAVVNNTSIFKTLKDQRTPFEVQVLTVAGQDSSGNVSYYTETYVDCWIQQYSKTYQVSNITVSENCTIRYADVL